MSCRVGCRHGLDQELLRLWCRPAGHSYDSTPSLGRSICHTCGSKKKKKKKKSEKQIEWFGFYLPFLSLVSFSLVKIRSSQMLKWLEVRDGREKVVNEPAREVTDALIVGLFTGKPGTGEITCKSLYWSLQQDSVD